MFNYYDVVQDRFGNGVAGYVVKIYDTGEETEKYSVVTDGLGRFVVEDMEEGLYDIKIFDTEETLYLTRVKVVLGGVGGAPSFYRSPDSVYAKRIWRASDLVLPPGRDRWFDTVIQMRISEDKIQGFDWANASTRLFKIVALGVEICNIYYNSSKDTASPDISVDFGDPSWDVEDTSYYFRDTDNDDLIFRIVPYNYNSSLNLSSFRAGGGNSTLDVEMVDYVDYKDYISIWDWNEGKGIQADFYMGYLYSGVSMIIEVSKQASVPYFEGWDFVNTLTGFTNDIYNVSIMSPIKMNGYELVNLIDQLDIDIQYIMSVYGGYYVKLTNNGTDKYIVYNVGA